MKGGQSLKATGIVRRIDDLGRVVIPKEIRRTLRIHEGDPLEIFIDRDGEVILKKYSPIGELGDFAQEYADSLSEATGHIACITDEDAVIAVAGAPKREFIEKDLSSVMKRLIQGRRMVTLGDPEYEEFEDGYQILEDDEDYRFKAEVIIPIIRAGDPVGSVVIAAKEEGAHMGDLEIKLAETAAGFLAKQMEDK